MQLSDYIPGVEQLKLALNIAIMVAFLGAAGWVWWQWHELKTLKADNAVLVENNKQLQVNADTLKSNLLTCQSANSADSATITALLNERADAQAAIAKLAAAKKADGQVLTNTSTQLNKLRQDPKNDGPLAPDLRETIRSIQKGRTQ